MELKNWLLVLQISLLCLQIGSGLYAQSQGIPPSKFWGGFPIWGLYTNYCAYVSYIVLMMVKDNISNYIISYELYCQIKRCNIWYAFVCAEKRY